MCVSCSYGGWGIRVNFQNAGLEKIATFRIHTDRFDTNERLDFSTKYDSTYASSVHCLYVVRRRRRQKKN